MTQLAGNYAEALYSLAVDETMEGQILSQLETLEEIFAAEPDFLRLLSSHSLSKEERCGELDGVFRDRVHAYVLNFLKILTEEGYIRRFSDCVRAYREFYDRDHGILPVTAVTAVPLAEDRAERLTLKLSALTGKTIRLTNRIDPQVLGGIRLDYNGRRIDGTLRNRLDDIGQLLKNTVL